MPRQRTNQIAPRYGIAEWYGRDIRTLTAEQRQSFGRIACQHEDQGAEAPDTPLCPFLSTLVPNARCNKAGGVCSIRKYAHGEGGIGTPVPNEKVVTTCPLRFIQNVEHDKSVFQWISGIMLDVGDPTIVKETPFLRKISDAAPAPEVEADLEEEAAGEKKAGRIDWILVDPATIAETGDLNWCALETQAVYFSGDRMRLDFDAYATAPSPVLYPAGRRRPDYRSNGPKRLAPQLDVKIPTLRAWGKKVAVLVDNFFFDQMNRLEDAYPRARNDRERRDNAEVVWFIVEYNAELRLTAARVVYTTLESSHHALNATEPLGKPQFTANLRAVIGSASRTNKVFKKPTA